MSEEQDDYDLKANIKPASISVELLSFGENREPTGISLEDLIKNLILEIGKTFQRDVRSGG